MNKILILALSLSFLPGCLWQEKAPEAASVNQEPVGTINKETKADNTAVTAGQENVITDTCQDIADEKERGLCKDWSATLTKAVENNSMEVCKELSDTQLVLDCQEGFISIRINFDASFCDGLTTVDLKSYCQEELKKFEVK